MFYMVEGRYEDYLRDESRKTGKATAISFPLSEGELIDDIRRSARDGIPVTFQGARTGITAGAVPDGGNIINLSRMNAISALMYEKSDNCFYITVEPGLLLCDLRKALETGAFNTAYWSRESKEALSLLREKGRYFFPPDPTEATASLGGMAACNASGARTFYYGPVRKYVNSLRAVLADGSVTSLMRGVECAVDGHFTVEAGNTCFQPESAVSENSGGCLYGRDGGICGFYGNSPDDGDSRFFKVSRSIRGCLPDYKMPEIKSAAGYHSKNGMDILDLFIGSEGTLGVISSLKLKLIMLPEAMYGLTAFFPTQAGAVKYVELVRNVLANREPVKKTVNDMPENRGSLCNSANLAAVEYFNKNALALLERYKALNQSFGELPEIKDCYHTAVYIEIHGTEMHALEMLMKASEILDECEGNADNTWIAMDHKEMERLKYFRHAVPEAVNMEIDRIRKRHPQVTKLGTDMSVPDGSLDETLAMYDTDIQTEDLQSVIFGHIGNNHLHVNIIPRNDEEYQRGQTLYKKWAQRVVAMGGSVSAEHGIGKVKAEMLKIMYGEKGIQQMKGLKALFDPCCRLNKGNLFR